MSDELSRVMRSSAEGLHPNVGMLTAGGLERGKRKRRMRRTGHVVGSAASVTAVFGAVALLGTHGSGGNAPTVSAAAPGTPTTNSVAPTTGAQAPTSTMSSTPSAPSAPPVSAAQMVDALKQALAPYHFTSEDTMYSGGTEDGTGGAFATLKLKWAAGTGTISITVARGAYDPNSNVAAVPYWTETKLQDGSILDLFDGPENPAGNGFAGENTYRGTLYRTDGTQIQFQTTNAPDEKAAPSATTQPVTKDQLKQVIQSSVWAPAIAAVKAEPDPQKIKVNLLTPPVSWTTASSRGSAH